MMISVFCRNGLTPEVLLREVLLVCFSKEELEPLRFTDDIREANLAVSYPYGNDFSRPPGIVTVAYICENLRIDRPLADFHFYVSEKYHRLPNSCRIQWHGLSPGDFAPPIDAYEMPEKYLERKFCNFVYRNNVGYREEFFDTLSKYKRVDAPSRSRNNVAPFDDIKVAPPSEKWTTKRAFLSQYKFTIAAENDVFAGYETEKLYDALRAHSVPIYIGNPYVSAVFNTDAFIAAKVPTDLPYWIERLEEFCQFRVSDFRVPIARRGLLHRLHTKSRILLRDIKNRWYLTKISDSLVGAVIEADKNPDHYLRMLAASKLRAQAAQSALARQRELWARIFRAAKNVGAQLPLRSPESVSR